METIELWYAVDQDGEGYFYTDEPYRADYTNIWVVREKYILLETSCLVM